MSEAEAVVSIVIPVVFMLTVAGVVLLRPLVRPLARYLEALTTAQEKGKEGSQVGMLHDRFEGLESRLVLLEERQNFTDALLANANPKPLGAGSGKGGEVRHEPPHVGDL
ncbi:MAG: hypothetical protein WEA09_11070 [Gemmatimonadota bacterium]